MMRYELSDYEWTAIKPMLLNKPRGVRRVWLISFGSARMGRHHFWFGQPVVASGP
jgi:transposase